MAIPLKKRENFDCDIPVRTLFFLISNFFLKDPGDGNSAVILGDDAISFSNLIFCSAPVYNLVPEADQVAKNPKVSRFY